MTITGGAFTYDDEAMREDLLGVLTNLTPTETQLVSGLGVSKASNIHHEWLMDTLNAVKVNAYIEGTDASYADLTHPTRLTNTCQIFREAFKVSDTEKSVNTAGFSDRYAYEATKALKELKNDMEYALMRGTIVCGDATAAARTLRGIKYSLSLITAQSGVSLTEAILNDYLQNVWAEGTEVNALYGGMYLKRKISAFTANSTMNLDAKDRRLVNAIDIYQADAARLVKLFAHRYVYVSGDTNYDLVGINEDLFRVAYLRKPFTRELAKTGDAEKGEVGCECTLENLHYNAGFWSSQHL